MAFIQSAMQECTEFGFWQDVGSESATCRSVIWWSDSPSYDVGLGQHELTSESSVPVAYVDLWRLTWQRVSLLSTALNV